MTMNAAPAAPAPTAQQAPSAAPAATSERQSLSSRVAALKASLDESPAPSEPAVESSDTPLAGSSAAASGDAAAPAVDQDASRRAADRLARIEQVRAKERAAEQDRQKREQGKARDGEVEKLRARIAELEPLNDVFKDEESLLGFAEKKGMTAEKLVGWMRTRLTDPNAVAQKQAQTVEDRLRAEMKALQDRLDATERKREEDKVRAESERTQEAKTTTFLTQVQNRAGSHPLTAKLHGKYGNDGLIGFANQFIAPLLRSDYSLDELYDHTEQLLEELQVGATAAAPAAPVGGTSHPPKKNGAGQPATTLSNALTAGRESLAEETPPHKLSRAERVRRLKEQP